MKKFLTCIITLTIVMVLCVCLSGCEALSAIISGLLSKKDNYSETYEGYVSEQTYDTVEDTVKGFLDSEIAGKTVDAVFVDYTKEKECSKEEVAELAIDEEYRDGLISVELGTVEYSEESSSVSAYGGISTVADGVNIETKTKKIYILTYTGMFRFFSPALAEGDALTASYYDSTFEAEKYINCSMNATISNLYTYDGVTYLITNSAVAKVTKTALYERDEYSASNGETVKSSVAELYDVDTAQGFWTVYNTGDGYIAAPVYEWSTINEYFMQWFDQRFGQLDHTYFEKTETGYALKSDKYAEYISASGMSVGGLSGDYDVEYIINIADGRMSDVYSKVAVEGYVAEMTISFYDFGNTSITIPQDVQALLP